MENNVLSEYLTALSDPSFRLTAERLTMKCGVRSDLKGSKCLVDAIILYGTELCTGFCEIYRIIGELRNIKPKSVMREIAYAISQAFGIVERLSKLVGVTLSDNDIHSGLVIAYLGKIFQHPDLALYA
ncbi:MAG: sporulation initiation factor Spo0A C-terminal domain-containing protein [Clostridiales bacterium]|nr:sporulation initiation factor Spo0A C-terminal domain-containing protein [Clostridiales bacterium]